MQNVEMGIVDAILSDIHVYNWHTHISVDIRKRLASVCTLRKYSNATAERERELQKDMEVAIMASGRN